MAAAFCGHTGTKTVCASTLNSAGLKCSFHGGLSGDRSLKGSAILRTPPGTVNQHFCQPMALIFSRYPMDSGDSQRYRVEEKEAGGKRQEN